MEYNIGIRAQQTREMSEQDVKQEVLLERQLIELRSRDAATPSDQGLEIKEQNARREAIYKDEALMNTTAK